METEAKTYWAYTAIGYKDGISTAWGVQRSIYDHFDFLVYYKEFPNLIILTAQQISEEYYNKMNEFINSKK